MANGSFEYQEKFDEVDPKCKSNFQRTLKHENWIDGQSVVQAESTAVDEGFNARFHKIEDDLDALGKDTTQSFTCIAEIRNSLYKIFKETEAEFSKVKKYLPDAIRSRLDRGLKHLDFTNLKKDSAKYLYSCYTLVPLAHQSSLNQRPDLTAPGGVLHDASAQALFLQDLQLYYLCYIVYCCEEGGTRPFDAFFTEFRDIIDFLEHPVEIYIIAIQSMKEVCINHLVGQNVPQPVIIDIEAYFDYLINAFS